MTVVALAMGLFELHFNRKTGQCDPGYPLLAKELGVSISTIERGIRALKNDGWLQVQRTGPDKVKITFTIPSSFDSSAIDGSVHALDPSQTAIRPVTKRPLTRQYGDGTKEHLNTEHRARRPTARAPVSVDRVSVTAPPLATAMAAAAAPLPRTEEEREAKAKFIEGLKAKFGPHWGIKQDTTRIR
jgi:hypothetical protein